MLKPPPRQKIEYEKVATDDWTVGVIDEIEFEKDRATGFRDEKTGEEIIHDSVRFKFILDGYKFPHKSNWMKLSYHEKSNLYIKYLSALVEGAKPDMDFDLEQLQGLPVKIMWKQNGEYQNVEIIRPKGAKVKPDVPF